MRILQRSAPSETHSSLSGNYRTRSRDSSIWRREPGARRSPPNTDLLQIRAAHRRLETDRLERSDRVRAKSGLPGGLRRHGGGYDAEPFDRSGGRRELGLPTGSLRGRSYSVGVCPRGGYVPNRWRRGGQFLRGRLPWYCEVHTTVSQDGRIYWTGTDSLGFWRLDLTDGSYLRAVIEAPLPRLTRAEIDSAAARISGSPSPDAHARWLRWFRGLDFPEVRPWTEDIDGCHRRDGLGGLGTESLPDAQRRLTRQCQTRPV